MNYAFYLLIEINVQSDCQKMSVVSSILVGGEVYSTEPYDVRCRWFFDTDIGKERQL